MRYYNQRKLLLMVLCRVCVCVRVICDFFFLLNCTCLYCNVINNMHSLKNSRTHCQSHLLGHAIESTHEG